MDQTIYKYSTLCQRSTLLNLDLKDRMYLPEIFTGSCYVARMNIKTVPVPTDVPYLYWDAENMHGMGIISLRHAAFNAGLGILGRNTLLINREFGNMVYIGAVLIDIVFKTDPIVTDFACPSNCNLCLDACPIEALDGVTVNQKRCREISYPQHPRGWDIYTCTECRRVCPLRNGLRQTINDT